MSKDVMKFGILAVLVVMANMAFWASVIAGTLYLVKHLFFS